MDAPESTAPEKEAWQLPLPAGVLVAYALVTIVGEAAPIATGLMLDRILSSYVRLDTSTRLAVALLMAAFGASVGGVLLRRRWGHKLLATMWCASYGVELIHHLPIVLTAPAFNERLIYRWLNVFHIVVTHGLWTATAAAYLWISLVRRRAQREPSVPWPDGDAMPVNVPLPFPGKLMAILGLAWGGVAVAGSVPLFEVFWPSWACLLDSPLDLLLGGRGSLLPIVLALLGGASILGGLGILWRQEWGRWLFIGSMCTHGLLQLAWAWSFYVRFWDTLGVPRARVLYDTLYGMAAMGANILFLVSYACDPAVKNAMRSDS